MEVRSKYRSVGQLYKVMVGHMVSASAAGDPSQRDHLHSLSLIFAVHPLASLEDVHSSLTALSDVEGQALPDSRPGGVPVRLPQDSRGFARTPLAAPARHAERGSVPA